MGFGGNICQSGYGGLEVLEFFRSACYLEGFRAKTINLVKLRFAV